VRVSDIPELAKLSTAEKILLVEDLWDSISSEDSAVPVPHSHKDELARRWVRHQATPGDLLSLDELQARLPLRR
jgi:putative addiction module component (TIGR02574 family)